MLALPASLQDALARAPRHVVAPVGLGFAQEALECWANENGRLVLRDPSEMDEAPSLLLPDRRSQLSQIPTSILLDHLLMLEESDVTFRRSDWRRALPDSDPDFINETFEESEGWPLALEICCRSGRSQGPLHQHPLVVVALERLRPSDEAQLEALRRAARSPVVIPGLHELLSLRPEEEAELLDIGYLRASRAGTVMPKLLRRFLQPQPEADESLAIAQVLAGRGRLDEALVLLADVELWEPYLELLAAGFEPRQSDGEERLRNLLGRVPADHRDGAPYLYLVAALDRLRGELDRAHEHYRSARRSAGGKAAGDAGKEMIARIENGRGIAFALGGELDQARKAFGSAIRDSRSGRLEAEARHNRAGVFVQQGRFAEAEKDLRQAAAAFREAGDYVREARSLQLLALSWHGRGLLPEARRGYEDALALLAASNQPTALLRANLAEVLLLSGQAKEAKAQLELASSDFGDDERSRGYIETNLALWHLCRGQAEVAARKLRALLRQRGLEAHLRAEAELLLARALRQLGDPETGLEHARRALSLGVAAVLEVALLEGGDLDEVLAQAREEGSRFELANALLHRRGPGDLEEALELIRTHGYHLLLDSHAHAPALAELARHDEAALALFPVRITTCSSFRVRFLGRDLTLADFPTRKSAALLVRLALASRPLPREVIAEELWGDAGNPVHSLQTALYHLNRTLGVQVIGGRKGAVEFIFPIEIDLERFEQAASETLDRSWGEGPDRISEVLALAAGQPLADFPEWFDDERRRIEGLQARLWRRLADLERGRPRRSAEALEALLRLEPYDVESRRRLIDIHRDTGESELARHQEECLRQMQSELSS